jgi:photosystem II stability/assembly factor-like uncharacterized protein
MRFRSSARILCFLITIAPFLRGEKKSTDTVWTRASVASRSGQIDVEKVGFNRIYFLPNGEGWVEATLTDSQGVVRTLAKSRDNGRSWRFLPPPLDIQFIDSYCFLDSNNGWIATTKIEEKSNGERTSFAVMLHTIDGGESWERWSSLEDLNVIGLLDMSLNKNGSGIAVGLIQDEYRQVILRTTDFGKKWIIENDNLMSYPPSRISVHNKISWILGEDTIVRWEGNKSWRVAFKSKEHLYLGPGIDSPTAMSVIATKRQGGVVRSDDGGLTWQEIQLPAPYEQLYLTSIKFADSMHGWLAGEKGVIFSSQDGGKTWKFESQVESSFLYDIAICNDRIFVVGNDGAIYWRWKP